MKKIKKEIQVPCVLHSVNAITLVKPYFEFIRYGRQTAGSEAWAEYKVALSPSERKDVFEIRLGCNAEPASLLPMIEAGVRKGLHKFIQELQYCRIGVKGFKLSIDNFSYHPVDSKSRAFEHTIYGLLKRLVKEAYFETLISSYEKETEVFTIHQKESAAVKNLGSIINIHLPRIYDQTAYLKENWQILFKDPQQQEWQYEVLISPQYKLRLPNHIYFSYHGAQYAQDHAFVFYDQLKSIRNIIRKQKLNLGGFSVQIKAFDLAYFTEITMEAFGWAILGILLDKENLIIKEENQ